MTAHYPASWWTVEQWSPHYSLRSYTRPIHIHESVCDLETGEQSQPCVTSHPTRVPWSNHSHYKTIKRGIFVATARPFAPVRGPCVRLFFGKIAVMKCRESSFRLVAIRSSFIFIRGNRIKNCFPPVPPVRSITGSSGYCGDFGGV